VNILFIKDLNIRSYITLSVIRQKILLFCVALSYIIFLNFSQTEQGQLVNPLLLYTRVIPTFVIFALTIALNVGRRFPQSIRELFRFPSIGVFWFLFVSILWGFVQNIQPLWSAWKCFEMVVVLYMGISIALQCREQPGFFFKVVELVNILSLILCLWILYLRFVVQGYSIEQLIFLRLNTEVPKMNAINLSVISAFGLFYNCIKIRRTTFFRLLIIVVFLLIFIASKSRTGLVVILVYILFWSVLHLRSSWKIGSILLGLGIGSLVVNQQVLEVLRISDRQEVLTLGGRLSSNVNETGAWPETLRFVERNMFIGLGNINLSRFLDEKRFAVDNFFLQSILASGLFGSIIYFAVLFYLAFWWCRIVFSGALRSNGKGPLIKIVSILFIIAFTRSLTTNDLAFHGFGFLLFVLLFTIYINRRILRYELQ